MAEQTSQIQRLGRSGFGGRVIAECTQGPRAQPQQTIQHQDGPWVESLLAEGAIHQQAPPAIGQRVIEHPGQRAEMAIPMFVGTGLQGKLEGRDLQPTCNKGRV